MSLYFSRRNFLKAGYSAVGAAVLSKWFTDVAEGRVIRGTVSSVFNGGRSQINPNALFNGGEYAFINMFKTADPTWSSVGGLSANSPITPDMLDANGYPTTLVNSLGVDFGATGGISAQLLVAPQSSRPGNWVVTWSGNGTIVANPNSGTFTPVSGSKTSSGGSGRYVFLPSSNNFSIGVASIGSPHITDIRVFHEDDETALNAGEVFGVKFKQRLVEGKPGVIRFLNWMGTVTGANSCNTTNWWSLKPASYVWYSGYEMRSSIYCGVTGSSDGVDYTASAPAVCSANGSAWDGVLRDKTTVIITINRGSSAAVTGATPSGVQTVLAIGTSAADAANFQIGQTITVAGVTGGTWTGLNGTATVAATGAGTVTINKDSSAFTGTPVFTASRLYQTLPCSLDVGGTGAKNILDSRCNALDVGTNTYPVGGTYQSISTLVYDATLDAWIKRGGDAAGGPIGLNTGVPPELMVRLCREVGSYISIPVPYFALTPATDYVPEFIKLIQTTAPSWMIPWFEGTNECWPTHGGAFLGTGYSNAVSAAYGWGQDNHNWYGKSISILGQILSAMYGADRTKYRVMCGVQTGTGTSPGNASTSNPRLSALKYVSNTGGLQGPQTLVWSGGTINISASVGVAEAWRWATHVTVANYVAPGFYLSPAETALATAYAGGDLTAPATYVDSLIPANSAVTFVNGTPGQVIWAGHPFAVPDERVYFLTIGSLPTGVSSIASVLYYVRNIIDADHFTISTTAGGTEVNISGSNSGCFAFAATSGFVIPAVNVFHQNWKAWAQSFSVDKLCGYEGGYSPDYTGGGASQVDLLRAAGKLVTSSPNSPTGMQGYTTTNYEEYTGLSGGSFVAEYPSCFQLGGKTPSANVWSVLENVYVTPDPPQWLAIKAFNA